MSEVNVFISSDEDELDELLQRVQLDEPDLDGGNNNEADDSELNLSQVPLFAAVGSPTDDSVDETSLALDTEGSNGERRPEGGPCQRPALSPIQTAEYGYTHVAEYRIRIIKNCE